MRIDVIVLCASLVVADNFEYKYLPSLMGKLDGERTVNPSNYRFLASLRHNGVHYCSATLLSNKHALTAATCLKQFLNEIKIPSFEKFSLVAGRFDINNGTTVFEIKQVQIHRSFKYISPKIVYNIGLVTLIKNNVKESEYVGWGHRTETRTILGKAADLFVWENIDESPRVKKITFQVLKEIHCRFIPISPIICTIFDKGNLALSEEDLGAPLIQNNVVIGILAGFQEKLRNSFIFVDLYKSRKEIDTLFNDRVRVYKNILSRKKARHDRLTFRRKKECNITLEELIRREMNHEETNYEETNHEEIKHEEHSHIGQNY